MKGARKQYEKIKNLPATAQSVANYAAAQNCTVSYIYKKFNEGKANYKIVDFEGYNFIIEN